MADAGATVAVRSSGRRREGTMQQAERRALTRARLIEAALDVFSLTGYEHASVDDIARAAGVSKGAFYFHFTTKEDALVELLRRWAAAHTDAMKRAGDLEERPLERLRSMLLALFSYGDDFRRPRLLIECWAQGGRSPDVARALRRTYRHWSKLFACAIAAGYDGPAHGSANDAAVAVLAMHDGLVCEIALGRRVTGAMIDARIAPLLTAFLVAAVDAPPDAIQFAVAGRPPAFMRV
jgi:AcrR family transcriptional regulator